MSPLSVLLLAALAAVPVLAFAQDSAGPASSLRVGRFAIHHGRAVAEPDLPATVAQALSGAGVQANMDALPRQARESVPVPGVTQVVPDGEGGYWAASPQGAAWWDGSQWHYRQGRRWLPGDRVEAIHVDSAGNAWVRTSAGYGVIERKQTTLAEKAIFYEEQIAKFHLRTPYEYVLEVELKQPGDLSQWVNRDSDNDGLWTGMYGAAQCFAYAATKAPRARERAKKAFRALAFLSEVTQGGSHPAPPGFPARAILPASGTDPNLHDSPERDRAIRKDRDKKWKLLSPRWPRSADGQWYWKTDTSSDELDGHYFLYGLYFDLVAANDAEREEVRTVVRRITDHLLAHNYALVDHDGTPTRWGVFGPDAVNLDRTWWVERGLNSLSMLTYLKVAAHITADPKYESAARTLIERHGYLSNLMFPKYTLGVGGGNQSDDEMAFMNYYHLLKYETDPQVKAMVAMSLAGYWELERPEANPFFNFVAASQLRGANYTDSHDHFDLSPKGAWLAESVDTLRRFPFNLVDWPMRNSHRLDLLPLPSYVRPDATPGSLFLRKDGRAIPVDERVVFHWNLDPYQVDSAGQGKRLADGTSFLLPYYMGLYEGFLKE